VKKKIASSSSQPRRRRAIENILLVIGCVLMIDALVGDKGLLAMLDARQTYREIEESLAALRSENAALRDEGKRLREDPTAIEEVARQELGLMMPGEKVFTLKDLPTPNGQ
jgi:cell division protein FtsB